MVTAPCVDTGRTILCAQGDAAVSGSIFSVNLKRKTENQQLDAAGSEPRSELGDKVLKNVTASLVSENLLRCLLWVGRLGLGITRLWLCVWAIESAIEAYGFDPQPGGVCESAARGS